MRIVGGALRGRSLASPKSQSVRPTTDRLRELIFDILAHAFDNACEGASVVDLFAGTGALGIEALSRGAARALVRRRRAPRRARCCAKISRRSGLAALRAYFAATRRSSASRRPAKSSRSPFSIRPMARRWRRWR